MAGPDLYVYRASVIDVHDGDTIDLLADQGFNEWHWGPFRLAGCNARELKDPGGPEARDNLANILPANAVVYIRSMKPNRPIEPDKYAPRWDARVFLPDGTDLVAMLITQNWLAPWDGTGSAPKPPWPRPSDNSPT